MSWISYAADHQFPIQNLPFGVFTKKAGEAQHIGVAIGDEILALNVLAANGSFFPAAVNAAFQLPTLNAFMAMEHAVWGETRAAITKVLAAGNEASVKDVVGAVVKQSEVEMVLPATVGDYTDFYASREHATNLGKMFRPNSEPLLENWLHIPVGYHGRSSSIVVSGTPLHRPNGQQRPNPEEGPVFGPCKLVDFELEMAAWIGTGNNLGEPVNVEEARKKIFGFSLFNDWSARDIQKWEYVPLGPFLGKNFASTLAPWIITLEALEPFRTEGPVQDPAVLPYLASSGPANYDIKLEVGITPKNGKEQIVSRSNFGYMYWNMRQQLAHHTVNGCNVRVGDLMASGTISGKDESSYGSMLEISKGGKQPFPMNDGSTRSFLEDGDTVAIRGWGEAGEIRVGFGEVSAEILPADIE